MASNNPWTRLSAHERYRLDNQFHLFVDVLLHEIYSCHYTPTELREACHLAACIYEEQVVRPILIDPKQPFTWNVRKLTENDEVLNDNFTLFDNRSDEWRNGFLAAVNMNTETKAAFLRTQIGRPVQFTEIPPDK